MKSKGLVGIITMTLIAALAIPVQLARSTGSSRISSLLSEKLSEKTRR